MPNHNQIPIITHCELPPFMQCHQCRKFFALKFVSKEGILSEVGRPEKLVHFRCKHCNATVDYLNVN